MKILDRYLLRELAGPFLLGLAIFLLLAFAVGVAACQITGRALGVVDHGAIVWDEIVPFWAVLLLNMADEAKKFGITIEGGTLYCNTFPCVICTKMILNAGIQTVVYDSDYDDPLSKEILGQQDGLKLVRYEGKKFRA